MDLRKRKFLKEMDKVYPRKNSPGFIKHIDQTWRNLENDYYIERLNQEFKPNRGKIDKLTIFYLWLFLCLERPWEKDGECSISEKVGEDTWIEIYDVLDKLPRDFPDLPDLDPRTLRKYRKRWDFILIATWIAVDQKSLIKLGKAILRLGKKMKSFGEQLRKIGSKNQGRWKLISKFIEFLKLQKYVSKRDLMRKLGINKKDCDSLLREAEKKGFVRIKQLPQNSIWIIYTGP